jgi:hypothetical protein
VAPIEMVRLAHPRNLTAQPQEIGHMLNPWLSGERPRPEISVKRTKVVAGRSLTTP